MLVFLKSHGHQGILTAGGALLYAFSMFSLLRGFHFYALLNVMYLFPFLLVQLESLIREKKEYGAAAKFALLVAVQACCSFYLLYMQTIFLVTYALLYYFGQHGRKAGWRCFFVKVIQIGGYYLLGVLTSGVILFPVLSGFFNSSRIANGIAQKSRVVFSLKELTVFFSNLLIPMTSDDNYGLGIPYLCFMAVVACLLGKRYSFKEKSVICLLAAAYMCPLFWSMTNGFSYESDRWTYILYFGMAYITVMVLEEYVQGSLPRTYMISAAFLAAASVIYHLILNGDKIRSGAYFMAAVICTIFLVVFQLKERQVLVLLYGGVWLNLFFLVAPWQLCGHGIWRSFNDKDRIAVLNGKINTCMWGADVFERIDVSPLSKGESLIAGYKGTTEYFSILNENTFEFWEKLMISPGIRGGSHHLGGLDARVPLEALMSVSQYQDGERMCENEYVLPLGVQYTQAISYDLFNKMSPLQRQHVLLENIVVEGARNVGDVSWEPVELCFEIKYIDLEREDDLFIPGNNAKIMLKIHDEEIKGQEGEFYVLFSDFQCFKDDFASINAGNHEFLVQNRDSKYYTGSKDYLVHASGVKNGNIEISLQAGNEYGMKGISVFWYGYEGMAEAISKLKENSVSDLNMKNDRITGNIKAQDGWLFFGIPYNSGWQAYVDGKKAEILRANAGFFAVYLEKGDHFVELIYKPVYFQVGMLCTLAGLAVNTVLFFKGRRCLRH